MKKKKRKKETIGKRKLRKKETQERKRKKKITKDNNYNKAMTKTGPHYLVNDPEFLKRSTNDTPITPSTLRMRLGFLLVVIFSTSRA